MFYEHGTICESKEDPNIRSTESNSRPTLPCNAAGVRINVSLSLSLHLCVYVYLLTSLFDILVVRFGKSNAGYVSWVVIGILGTEVMTGWVTDTLWTSLNYGKTYETVDWSKFKSADEDDEEEEEEEGMFDNYMFGRERDQCGHDYLLFF